MRKKKKMRKRMRKKMRKKMIQKMRTQRMKSANSHGVLARTLPSLISKMGTEFLQRVDCLMIFKNISTGYVMRILTEVLSALLCTRI